MGLAGALVVLAQARAALARPRAVGGLVAMVVVVVVLEPAVRVLATVAVVAVAAAVAVAVMRPESMARYCAIRPPPGARPGWGVGLR